jgi:hypothetical protein
VCTEAVAVVRAVGADFFLDRWHVEYWLLWSDHGCYGDYADC